MTRQTVSKAEAEAARAWLAASYQPCGACDNMKAGPIHRKSSKLWRFRSERARLNGGVDPESGVTLAVAEAHLAQPDMWP